MSADHANGRLERQSLKLLMNLLWILYRCTHQNGKLSNTAGTNWRISYSGQTLDIPQHKVEGCWKDAVSMPANEHYLKHPWGLLLGQSGKDEVKGQTKVMWWLSKQSAASLFLLSGFVWQQNSLPCYHGYVDLESTNIFVKVMYILNNHLHALETKTMIFCLLSVRTFEFTNSY